MNDDSKTDDHLVVARRMALTTFSQRDEEFRHRCLRGTSRFKLTEREQGFLRTIYSARRPGGRLYWSNREVRRASAEALINAFLEDLRGEPGKERWLAVRRQHQ
jgi:hypothetical protein